MTRKWPLFFILKIALVIAFLHFTGLYLHLYWRLPPYDILSHFMGGFLVTFICLTLIYFKRMPNVKKTHVLALGIFAAISIGVVWEIFELQSGITSFGDAQFLPDTLLDIICDITGGLVAIIYFIKEYGYTNKRLS